MISVGGSVVALHPLAAAAVSDGHHQRQQIDAAGQTTPHDVLVTGVLAPRIHHDERHLHALLVDGPFLAGQHPVGTGVLAVVGGQDDDRVVAQFARDGPDHPADLLVHHLHDLRVAVLALAPVLERGDSDLEGTDPREVAERELVGGSFGRIAIHQSTELAGEGLAAGFVGGQLFRRLPVARKG